MNVLSLSKYIGLKSHIKFDWFIFTNMDFKQFIHQLFGFVPRFALLLIFLALFRLHLYFYNTIYLYDVIYCLGYQLKRMLEWQLKDRDTRIIWNRMINNCYKVSSDLYFQFLKSWGGLPTLKSRILSIPGGCISWWIAIYFRSILTSFPFFSSLFSGPPGNIPVRTLHFSLLFSKDSSLFSSAGSHSGFLMTYSSSSCFECFWFPFQL